MSRTMEGPLGETLIKSAAKVQPGLGAWSRDWGIRGLGFSFYPPPFTFPMFLLLYESSRFINTLWIRIAFSAGAALSSSSAMVGVALVAKEKASLLLPRRWVEPALRGRGLGRGAGRSRGGGEASDFPRPEGFPSLGRRAGPPRPRPRACSQCPRAVRALCCLSSLSFGNSGNTSQCPPDPEH